MYVFYTDTAVHVPGNYFLNMSFFLFFSLKKYDRSYFYIFILYCTVPVWYPPGTCIYFCYLLLIFFFQFINIKLCFFLPINASAATTSPAVVGHASADIRTTTTSTGIVQAVRARGFNTIGVSSTGVDFAAGGPRWAGWHVTALNSVVLKRHISQTSFDLFSIGIHKRRQRKRGAAQCREGEAQTKTKHEFVYENTSRNEETKLRCIETRLTRT